MDPWDEVFVAGEYLSSDAKLDSFSFPSVTAPHDGIYIGKLDPGGNGLWVTGIVSPSTNVVPLGRVAVDSNSGGVAVAGAFQGTVDLGDGTPVTSPNGVEDLFVTTRHP